MRQILSRPSVAALAAALALAACAAPAAAQSGPISDPVARARADSARLPYTAADVRFMSTMIGHHAQAITMSRLVPARTSSASVRTLADRIISAQQDEIATMQRWLRDRRQPVPAADDAHDAHDEHAEHAADAGPAAHAGHGAHAGQMSGMQMPGMLSAAQLAELAAARGAEFDRLFLTFMIQHHRGATAMVRELFGTPGAGQDETVFKFASDVNVDQQTEIARMQRMLTALLVE